MAAEQSTLVSADIALTLQRAIFNSPNYSKIVTDAAGVIQIFNVGAERMLGFAAEDVVNKITPAAISEPRELIARSKRLSLEFATPVDPGFEALAFKAARGIEEFYELTYIRKDGSRFPAMVSVTALRDSSEAIIGYMLIGTDNTMRNRLEAEQKELDRALKKTNLALQSAKQAADKANLAKTEFLSSMSHELRSPMNAILGFAQLLESSTPPPTPEQRDSIGQILQAGWYLLELINEVLDLALIESGKLSLSPEPVSLSGVISDCRGMIEPLALKNGIVLRFPRLTVDLFVEADRTRLKQVLINLLSNAIKYNRRGGTVEVTLEPGAMRRTKIAVRDTGDGLPPEMLSQLFQSFNRLGRETGSEEGTGIGLVVCKRLAELMSGTIGAESSVGVGSRFWIELRSCEAPHLPPAACGYRPASRTRFTAATPACTLLCIEDNPANLMLIEKLLERRSDIELLVAQDGARGIEIARSVHPDVVVMDINLPGMSGLAALGLLTEDPLTARIPVIALSANAMPDDILNGLAAGFFRYLTKPIRVSEFMETLDSALGLRNVHSKTSDATGTL